MLKILIVDDEPELAEVVQEFLQAEGYEADLIQEPRTALSEALSGRYDLVLLDVKMPEMDGFEFLRQIRPRSRVPIIMLTAMNRNLDRIMGLELGADDFVAKSCPRGELVARIRAVLRRIPGAAAPAAPALSIGALRVCASKRRASWEGKFLDLTSTEFELLDLLARHAGRAVSKKELSELALGRPYTRFDRSIDMHISSLRQKLPTGKALIVTVRGRGYQLVKD
jgi:DNA-binding response OmpR family regulator